MNILSPSCGVVFNSQEVNNQLSSDIPDNNIESLESNNALFMAKKIDEFRKNNILNPENEKIIEKINVHYEEKFEQGKNIDELKYLIGECLSVKERYKESHYTFFHGQCSYLVFLSYLIKEMVKITQPDQKFHEFKFLRAPQDTGDGTSITSAKEFLEKHSKIYDHNLQTRTELLPVDGYMYGTHAAESAMGFLMCNKSYLSETLIRDKNRKLIPLTDVVFKSVFKEFGGLKISDELNEDDEVMIQKFVRRLNAVCDKKQSALGNIFAICIPKDLVQDDARTPIYRAIGFGPPLENPFDIKSLEEIQSGKISELEIEFGRTQYRILTSALSPENNIKTFAFNMLSKQEKRAIKSELAGIARDWHSWITTRKRKKSAWSVIA